MKDTPIRHMLFLAALLFIILSSGSLQCALNCYDRAAQYSSGTALVADCHPLAIEELAQSPVSNFCHHSHSDTQLEREPILHSIAVGQFLALSGSRLETPKFRSPEPVIQTFALLTFNNRIKTAVLPLSQNLKQLRSTILVI